MKKKLLVLASAAVLCISAVFPSYAKKIIYSDGTVYDSSDPSNSSGSSSSSDSSETASGSNFYVPNENSSIPQPPAAELSEYQLPVTVVYIKASGISRVNTEPSASGGITTKAGEMFRFVEDAGDFYKIMYDGKDAYIAKSDNAELRNTVMMDAGMDMRAQIVTNAFNYLGMEYEYGGTGASGTYDCSGFTAKVMADAGISLPHSSSAQAECGTQIDVSELRPGDLVFYANTEGTITHVAMYIGNGMLIHSFDYGYGIRVDRYNYKSEAPCCFSNVIGDQN